MPYSIESENLIKLDRIILFKVDAFFIQKIQIFHNKIDIIALGISSILSYRTLVYNKSTNVRAGVLDILEQNFSKPIVNARTLQQLNYDVSLLPLTNYDFEFKGVDVAVALSDILNLLYISADWKYRPINREYFFSLRQGVETNCEFSQNFRNVTEETKELDNLKYKNTALISLEEDVIYVGSATGIDRRETYIDGKEELSVQESAKLALKDKKKIDTVNVVIDSANAKWSFGSDYKLMDTVLIKTGDNRALRKRLTDVVQYYDISGEHIELTLEEVTLGGNYS